MTPKFPITSQSCLAASVILLSWGCGGAAQPTAQSNEPPIQLTPGVAQVQYGGDQPLMGFGVPYDFRPGTKPHPTLQYVWVIEPDKGKRIEREVELTESGSLEMVTPQVSPEDEPFTTYIEARAPDGSRTRVSNRVTCQPLVGRGDTGNEQ